ncbi:MAG: arabinose operon transcriptional regulator AraC [Halioglobus sp.]
MTITPIIRHAHTSWKIFQGQAVTLAALRESMLTMSGDHRGNITDRTAQLYFEYAAAGGFSSQPEVPALIRKWKHLFEPVVQLSESEALRFLTDAGECIELMDDLMDELFADHSLSAVTKMVRGASNDTVTHRPAGKLRGWSLNLSVSGTGHYNCIRRELFAGPGDMVLLSPDAMYDYRRAQHASHWTHDWVYFQPDPRILDWLNWAEIGPHIYHLKLPDSDYPAIRALFESTLDFDPIADSQSEALLLNIIEQIFIRCARLSTTAGNGPTDSRVKNAMNYINSNLEKSLTVGDIAQHVQLSKTQLSTMFKDKTGSTIISWREERRIARASRLLTQTTLQIQEIANQIGYEDPLYFSRTFSRLVGCSPRIYRQNRQVRVN